MMPEQVEIRRFQPTDSAWLIEENVAHYARSDGFDETFGTAVRDVVTGFADNHAAETEAAWIAETSTMRLGSIFCVKGDTPTAARLKLFFLVEHARGQGIGQRLLDTCISFARQAGYTTLTLRTHESHRAAGQLYAKNGFRLTRSIPRSSFGVDVVEQHFERKLT